MSIFFVTVCEKVLTTRTLSALSVKPRRLKYCTASGYTSHTFRPSHTPQTPVQSPCFTLRPHLPLSRTPVFTVAAQNPIVLHELSETLPVSRPIRLTANQKSQNEAEIENALYLISTKRQRVRKMNKHRLKKRRRRMKTLMKRIGKLRTTQPAKKKGPPPAAAAASE